jgi:hypothetical protein
MRKAVRRGLGLTRVAELPPGPACVTVCCYCQRVLSLVPTVNAKTVLSHGACRPCADRALAELLVRRAKSS